MITTHIFVVITSEAGANSPSADCKCRFSAFSLLMYLKYTPLRFSQTHIFARAQANYHQPLIKH